MIVNSCGKNQILIFKKPKYGTLYDKNESGHKLPLTNNKKEEKHTLHRFSFSIWYFHLLSESSKSQKRHSCYLTSETGGSFHFGRISRVHLPLSETLHLFRKFSSSIISGNRPLSVMHGFSTSHLHFSKICYEWQKNHVLRQVDARASKFKNFRRWPRLLRQYYKLK